MQTTSELYKELLANGAAKEVKIEIAGETYEEDRICGLFTTGSLFSSDTLSVGCAVARQIDLVLKNYENIPKMAKLVPYYRLVSGDVASEWVQKGVFYIDTRLPDKTSGTLTIHGFDDMLKGSAIWEPDQSLDFPMTCRKAAQVIAGLMGIELDNPEAIDDTDLIVDYPTNDYTQRNVLQFIAAAHAANFVMTDLGKLRMVGINDIPVETGNLVTEIGRAILFGGVRIKVAETTENNLSGSGEKAYVGGMVASTGAPPSFDPISKVIVKVDEENAWVSGDDTGYILEVTCPYGTQALADKLLSKVKGFVYRPFTAEDAMVDQAIELGDGITVDGVYTILAQQDITFDMLMAGRVAAPGQQEVESEYPYQTKEQQVDLKIARTRSLITKTAEEISLEIIGLENAFSEMELTLEGYGVRIQDAEGNLAELELATEEFRVSINGLEGDYAELALTIDGLTVTDSTGTTKIRGSSVETETLYVDAANITGTLTVGQLSSEVATEDQIPIYTSELINNSGYQNASGVVSIVNGTVTADYIYALGVEASTVRGNVIYIKNYYGNTTATITPGASTASGFDLSTSGNMYLHSDVQVTLNSSGNIVVVCGGGSFYPSGTAPSLGNASGMWSAVYALTGTIQTSDRNLKNSIEDLDEKYLRFILWLTPKRYKINNGTSDRYHIGFIAQDVWEGMELFGITDLEFAGFIRDVDAEGNEILMLRYEEFIGLLCLALQNHEERLLKLEAVV